MSHSAIEIINLCKTVTQNFKRQQILDNVSFSIEQGESFGFLGANGAGKTTTIKILMGLAKPTSGQVKIMGKDAHEASTRHHVSFLPEHPEYPKNLTALEFLKLSAELAKTSHRTASLTQVLDRVGLEHAVNKRISAFSKGMRQRLGIAHTLLNDPDIFVLDEPMSGLDPLGRQEVASLIMELKQQGKTLFFSTHILNDAQLLCDRIAFLQKGKLLDVYQHQEFSQTHMQSRILIASHVSPDASQQIKNLDGVQVPYTHQQTLHIEVEADSDLWKVLEVIQKEGAQVLSMNINPNAIKKYWS